MNCQAEERGVASNNDLRPLLKWPGGKRLLADRIVALLPQTYERYIEPFLGGGAVFFRLKPARALLADADPALIDCYMQIRDHPDDVLKVLARLKNSEADYYRIRASRPRTATSRAARIIYLTNLSFNGIYRLNFRGEFNVPYGHRPHRRPTQPALIRAASRFLRAARLRCDDFEFTLRTARVGDVVYLDPPYTVAHSNNGFIRYNARLFSWSDQQRLALAARRAADRGAFVVVTNADHESVRNLYRDFYEVRIERVSTIAAASAKRKLVTESIFYAR
ncbi:MAG TPA: Dam family site-specific DNA-(adenine-N6)-methyltransferase [Thermoanaerobaculia bacterium]|nr:Dam family site-specific DNA-(adenine-N6)-methyltransferase [Thermoanaerobaculia bacterium]